MQVPIIKITLTSFQGSPRMEKYVDGQSEDIFNRQIVHHVSGSMNGLIKHNMLCQFIDEHGSKYNVSLDKSSWKKSLTKANEYFLRIEEYETCQIIQDLINKI